MTLAEIGSLAAAFAAGATGMLSLKNFFAKKAAGLPKPIRNGERASILETLDRLEEQIRSHARLLNRYGQDRMDMEFRIEALENADERRAPISKTDRRPPRRELDQPDTTP